MNFLVDAQVPPVLAGWQRKIGHEAEHVHEVGLGGADDLTIRAYAIQSGAVVITKDRDSHLPGNRRPKSFGCGWGTSARAR